MKKLKNNRLLKLGLTIGITAAFFAACVALALMQNEKLYTGFISTFASEQKGIVTLFSEKLDETQSVDELKKIMETAPTDGARHWFLYSDDGVIFERNSSITETVSGLSKAKLAEYFIRSGGEGINGFFSLIDEGADFSAVIVKDNNKGRELVTVRFIEIDGKRLVLGAGVSESYILSQAKIGESRFNYIFLIALLGAVLTGSVSAFASRCYSKTSKLEALEKRLAENHVLVQGQSQRLFELYENTADKSVDILTGLYSRDFFQEILEKLDKKPNVTALMIMVKIKDLNEINLEQGYDRGNKLLLAAANIISRYTGEKDIAARIGGGTFVLLKTGIDFDDGKDEYERLGRELLESQTALYSTDFAYKKENEAASRVFTDLAERNAEQ